MVTHTLAANVAGAMASSTVSRSAVSEREVPNKVNKFIPHQIREDRAPGPGRLREGLFDVLDQSVRGAFFPRKTGPNLQPQLVIRVRVV